jgi:methylenetetrahydrofolate reductase (NADPH)
VTATPVNYDTDGVHMTFDSRLARRLQDNEFVITAEHLPRATTDAAAIEACARIMAKGPTAVNVADNHNGVALSSLVASAALVRAGVEPVYQLVTRDRNRIALQSDLMGAALLGIRNVLCLSGYHQTLIGCPDAANVYDIDSIQLVSAVAKMNREGLLMDGARIDGTFSMLVGAVANPFMRPLELNLLRLAKKVNAGASFIQTQAIFDLDAFREWLEAARREGLCERTSILAGVLPLSSATEAERLAACTDINIPGATIERIRAAGDAHAQRREGLAVCVELTRQVRTMRGLRGIHILSGGNESVVPELLSAAGL